MTWKDQLVESLAGNPFTPLLLFAVAGLALYMPALAMMDAPEAEVVNEEAEPSASDGDN